MGSVNQPFQPTILEAGQPKMVSDGKELLSIHTLKDLIGCKAFFERDISAVKNELLPDVTLFNQETVEILDLYREELGLHSLRLNNPHLLNLFNVFIYYHDIGKENDNRFDHELKGALKFSKINLDLNSGDKAVITWFIKNHGKYAELDTARRLSPGKPDYYYIFDKMIEELQHLPVNLAEKVAILKLMALFNLVEGLQSDRFGWTMSSSGQEFLEGYKYTDILAYYKQAIDAINPK